MDHSGIIATVDGENKNWINTLPNCILSHVLSLLTTKDAVDTCMLSHQWRHLWKHPILTRPNLEFDIPNIFGGKYDQLFEEHEAYIYNPLIRQFERQCFVRRVNEFLLLFHGNKVDSFKVAFFLGAESTANLDKWVHFAITKGAQALDLQLSCHRIDTLETESVYVFPHWILSDLNSSTLKHLSLQRCVLKPPTDYFDRFIQLTTLCLCKVNVDPVFLAHLFSSCSPLESLTLRCCRVGYLAIGPSLGLKDLKVLDCIDLEKVEIDAVNLSSLEYSGNHLKISCMRTPQLVRYFYSGTSKGALPYALTQLASCLGLETLHLQIWNSLEDIPQPVLTFRNLKQVNLDLFVPNFDLGSVVNMLKAAPLLEEFIVTVRPASYHGDVRSVSGFSHGHLRKFKMQGFQGMWIEIELAICILKIATKLEVLVIDPYGKFYNGGGRWTEINYCYYVEGNEKEVVDEDEENIVLCGIEDAVDLNYLYWKQRGSAVVRQRLKEVMTDAQVIIL